MLRILSEGCIIVGLLGLIYGVTCTDEPKALKWGIWCACWIAAGLIFALCRPRIDTGGTR